MTEPYTMLKVWVVTPTPRAMVRMATSESPGVLISMRTPYRRSEIREFMMNTPTVLTGLKVSVRRTECQGAVPPEREDGHLHRSEGWWRSCGRFRFG